jgi:hypothetical protein
MPTRYIIRSHSRFPTKCPVYYLGSDFLGKGMVRDLSPQGWSVDGDHAVEPGMTLTLAVFAPNHTDAIRVEKALIRWARDGVFGLRILVMEPGESARLEQLVASLLHQQSFRALGSYSSLLR